MSDKNNLDRVRADALARIERTERQFKGAILGAAVFEFLFLAAFLFSMEQGNRTHLLLLISTVGGYTVIVLGLFVLGIHSNRNTARILKAIELLEYKS
jgi:hypothetical protein